MRFASTVGVVVEVPRPKNQLGMDHWIYLALCKNLMQSILLFLDTLRWYCDNESCRAIVYQESFYCTDLGVQLKPVIVGWQHDEKKRYWFDCMHFYWFDSLHFYWFHSLHFYWFDPLTNQVIFTYITWLIWIVTYITWLIKWYLPTFQSVNTSHIHSWIREWFLTRIQSFWQSHFSF